MCSGGGGSVTSNALAQGGRVIAATGQVPGGGQPTSTADGGTRTPPAPDLNTGTPGTDQSTGGTRIDRKTTGSGLNAGASSDDPSGRRNKGAGLRM